MKSMSDREQCLALIRAVLDAAADPQGAYLIRMRLKRAVLKCQRTVAAELGMVRPESPCYLAVDRSASEWTRRVAQSSNVILGQAQALCQPSEALDVRWKLGWRRLDTALRELECLIAEGESGAGTPTAARRPSLEEAT